MAGHLLKHTDLDARLDRLAQDPERFGARALELADELDAQGADLEITNPQSWRREALDPQAPPLPLRHQLRSEVGEILPLDRGQESRLARRIEFARLRLERALEEAGMGPADLEGGVHYSPSAAGGRAEFTCLLPPRVCRRWAELHALRSEMVERNLYLVLINVERYAHTSASRLDLVQEGSAALYRAVDGFDWRRGLLFRTYAVHWLNQAFRSHLYNFGSTVRVPVYLQKALKHIRQAVERLRDPNASVETIARETGLGESVVASALAASRSTRSLDVALDAGGEGTALRDVLSAQDEDPYHPECEEVSLEEGLGQALDRLHERERYVVRLRFGLEGEREHTLAEVARKLGVSLERVRQIQVRAITKLRTPTLRKVVDPFLN